MSSEDSFLPPGTEVLQPGVTRIFAPPVQNQWYTIVDIYNRGMLHNIVFQHNNGIAGVKTIEMQVILGDIDITGVWPNRLVLTGYNVVYDPAPLLNVVAGPPALMFEVGLTPGGFSRLFVRFRTTSPNVGADTMIVQVSYGVYK